MGVRRRLRSLLTVAIFVTGLMFMSVPASACPFSPGTDCFALPPQPSLPTLPLPSYCYGWPGLCLR